MKSAARRERRGDAWSGRVGFVLATMGSAVGLGSIWKFPYEVGSNGGAAFVLVYVAGLVVIVFPLVLAEFALGRRGGADAVRSLAAVAAAAGASPSWRAVGHLGVVTAFLILSFYSVVGGWAVAYLVDTVRIGLPAADGAAATARFDTLLSSPAAMSGYHAVFMAATAVVVGRGVARGIEQASKVLMPVLIVLIVVLGMFAALRGDLSAALRFLFAVDVARLTPRVALEALGLGFFSIGVGLSLMVTYAAYAGDDIDLREVAVITVVGDTAVSLASGLAVFHIVFAEGLDPAGGPGLMFVTLPIAFARIPFGFAVALGFFVLLVVAALASAISLLEMPVAFLVGRGWRRPTAALVGAVACWSVGLLSVASFSVWAHWHPLAAIPAFAQATVFDLIDHLTSNIMLPVGGFAIAVLVGWILPAGLLAEEAGLSSGGTLVLRILLRWVVPASIAALTVAHAGG